MSEVCNRARNTCVYLMLGGVMATQGARVVVWKPLMERVIGFVVFSRKNK